MPIFPQKKKVEVTYVDRRIIVIGKDRWHHSDHTMEEIRNALALIIKNQNKMAKTFAEVKAQVEAQSTALDTIGTNVTGIQGDVAKLKQLIADLQSGGGSGGATAAQVEELGTLVDAVDAKITEIGATTSALDAETE